MYPLRQLILLSSSSPHGYSFLEYARHDIEELFKSKKVNEVLFVPYALKDHNCYTSKVQNVLEKWGYKVRGIHTCKDQKEAILSAEAIFIGGGNTFQLLKALYDNSLLDPIRHRVLNDGVPYMGSSAGTNVSTVNICTTNDMPIVYPPSFDALKLVPFNINPHYLDPHPGDTHQGETREERILQYLEDVNNHAVLGMREGATLRVDGNNATLLGVATARLFQPGKQPMEYPIGADFSFLFNEKK